MSWEHIAELFSKISSKYLIVEFIPREDEKVKILFNGRGNNFKDYLNDLFINKLKERFQIIEFKTPSKSNRILYLCELN
jgi:hypothetical protein